MKRQALEQVIDQHVHKIKKHCHLVPGSFLADDIHDLRVEYKKIRAFLRLLQLEPDAGDLQIPEKLKALYKTAGQVRDLQLFLIEMNNLPVAASLPVFIQLQQRQLFQCKESLIKVIEDLRFKKILASICKELPHQLQTDTIQKFIQQKIAAIHIILLAAEGEEELHSVRKNMKDLIYNNRLFESELQLPFPMPELAGAGSLTDMASHLGDFNDRCNVLSLLEHRENIPVEETVILDELQASWEKEKLAMQEQLLQQLQQSPLHVS